MMRFRRREAGFSLLEMAMVLVIIGVVMSAVMVGTDVLRHAKGQKAFSVFISGWHGAFSEYTRVTRSVPGDTASPPANRISGALGQPLCNAPLINAFLGASISLPQGQGVGQQDSYIYQDSSGSPHVLQICFVTLNWSVQVASPGGAVAFAPRERHVMLVQGLTVELALQMDALIDGSQSARFGQFRMFDPAAATSPHVSLNANQIGWGPVSAGNEDSARTLVTAVFEMY